MADAAVTFLLENVSQLLNSNTDLISAGSENELQQLQTELGLLKSFSHEAAKNPKEEEPFREMERQIREVVYEVEDIIDSCLTQAAATKTNNIFRRDLTTKPVSLAEKVRSLREDKVKPMFDKAKMDFANMKFRDGSDTRLEEPQTKVKKVATIRQESVVGLEDEQATIINYVMEPTEALRIIPIIGVAGQGKTTLARKIYQSQTIQYEFPTRIWVYISSEFNKREMFLSILKEVTSKDVSGMSNFELMETTGYFLEKKKFLLVLDDVLNPLEVLFTIQCAFPACSNWRMMMNRILITSRRRDFCSFYNHVREPHEMRFLTVEESLRLLLLRVFGELHDCPGELVNILKHIVSQCDGLPLEIAMIGGILVGQFSRTQSMIELKRACENVCAYISKYIRNDREGLIWRTVKLSYKILPDDLRDCFLYLGVFPEDYEISARTLTRLWIAEGFIQHNEGQSLEETAEQNLKDLINMNLVIADKVSPDGKVKTCHVPDVIRDLSIIESQRNANIFQEISKPYWNPRLQKRRRLYIHSDVLDFFSSSESYVPGARSFLCFSKTESMLLPEDTSKIPKAFELLRVLDIRPIRFTRFPLELTQLICLRYIALSSDFKVLPEAVSSLRNTQTLIIHTSSRTLLIKADIWKMIQLRHVKTNASIILLRTPENSGGQELQTLACLSPQNCTNDVFDHARYLKKLGIRGTLSILVDGEVGSRKFDNLEKLNDLENLKLVNDIHISSPSEGRLPCLPPPDKFPPKLRSLTLSATFLNWEHMSVLGMLEKLEVLKLKDNAFVGECWEVVDGGFRSLQVLQIGYTNLVFWKASGHHFPRLRCLMLRNCEKLEALPEGLATIPSLQLIDLHCPSKTAAASARKIQQEILQMEGNSRSREFNLSIIHPPDK